MKHIKLLLSFYVIAVFCLLTFSPSFAQEAVWLTVQDGAGLPGATGRTVDVNLQNDSETITYIEMSVCDQDNYLIVTNGVVKGRALAANCSKTVSEIDGCAYIRLYSCDNPIASGPEETFLTLSYSVSPSATQGECLDMYQTGITVKDQYGIEFSEEAVGTRLCNGDFGCDGDVDGSDAFAFKSDFGRVDCCTESCNGDFDRDCDVDGSDAFAFKSDFGRVGCLCSEFCFICTSDPDCEDGSYCNGDEVCNLASGGCDKINFPRCPDDGVYCNGQEVCLGAQCWHKSWVEGGTFLDPGEDPCRNNLYCDGLETCDELADSCEPGDWPCTLPDDVCLEWEGLPGWGNCCEHEMQLEVVDAGGDPGDNNVEVTVKLFTYPLIKAVLSMNAVICEDGGDGNSYLACTGCDTTGLITQGYDCNATDLGNGCCQIGVLNAYQPIPSGYRSIIKVLYDVEVGAPSGTRTLTPTDIVVPNQDPPPVYPCTLPVSGDFDIY